MSSYLAVGGYPPLADVRAWLQIAATNLPDAELELIAAAEQANQARLSWGSGELPPDVLTAFLRRVQRHAYAKTLPSGIIAADAEFGTIRLSRWDPEVERLESAYTVVVVA